MSGHVVFSSILVAERRDVTQSDFIIFFIGPLYFKMYEISPSMERNDAAETFVTWNSGGAQGRSDRRRCNSQMATVGIPARPVSCWMSLRNVCVGSRVRMWTSRTPLHVPLCLSLSALDARRPLSVIELVNLRLWLCRLEEVRRGVWKEWVMCESYTRK